jgi:L,D-transpeptidase YcbB
VHRTRSTRLATYAGGGLAIGKDGAGAKEGCCTLRLPNPTDSRSCFVFLFKRRFAAATALALLAATGCNSGGGGATSNASAQAEGVTPEALRSAVGNDEGLRRFYEARQWQSAWNDEAAEQLNGTLGNAVRHGLDPKAFTDEAARGSSPVEREVARTKAALSYANALAHGRADPKRLFEVYTLPRNQVDVPAGLAQAVNEGKAAEWIESLAPQDDEYRRLSEAYVQHLQATQQPQQPQQGQNGQADQKGKAKGKATPPAQQAPMAARDRAVVLAVNLERRRWLVRNPDATRIDVNTAAAFLRYHRDGEVADQRVVVNGEPGWETPQLGSPLFRLVANPNWTVPESIQRDELSKLSPAQLARRKISQENGRMVQQPGPENALGLVKLDMRNDEAIYLHDTPSKAAFQQPLRHLSHGCVRVSDAIGFARLIADHTGKRAEFDQALANPERKTTFIDLGTEIPVRLLYHTAYFDGDRLMFAPDPYGWDAKVAEALGYPPPPASAAAEESAEEKRRRREGDFGP